MLRQIRDFMFPTAYDLNKPIRSRRAVDPTASATEPAPAAPVQEAVESPSPAPASELKL